MGYDLMDAQEAAASEISKSNISETPRCSAELHSAVSQSWTLPGLGKGRRVEPSDTLPNTIRRYSRLKICATVASLQRAKREQQIHILAGRTEHTIEDE